MPKRRDANHAEIRDAFRALGASVADTADLGDGFPDLVVGWRGCNYLVEIKTRTGKLTPDEVKFFDAWKGQAVIVRTVDDAQKLLDAWS